MVSKRAAVVADIRADAWYRFVIEIDELLATGKYTWAEPTLSGIRQVVECQGRVTANQRRAVKNIEAGRWIRRRW